MEQHSGDLAAGIRYLSVLHVGEDLVAIPLMHCVMVVVFLRVLRIVLRVDAVGKEAALAFLRVCVLDLQRRGSQTVFGKVLNGLLDGGQLLLGILHDGRITV